MRDYKQDIAAQVLRHFLNDDDPKAYGWKDKDIAHGRENLKLLEGKDLDQEELDEIVYG